MAHSCLLTCQQRDHARVAISNADNLVADLHEGCGRAKLADVVLLTDRKSLKTVLEFRREQHFSDSSHSVTCDEHCPCYFSSQSSWPECA